MTLIGVFWDTLGSRLSPVCNRISLCQIMYCTYLDTMMCSNVTLPQPIHLWVFKKTEAERV